MAVVNLQSVTEAALVDADPADGNRARQAQGSRKPRPSPGRTDRSAARRKAWQYSLALVPGYRVRIQAGDRQLDYHAGARGALTLCPADRSVDPLPGDSMI